MSFFSREENPSEEVTKLVQDRFDIFYKVLQTEDYWVCGNVFENLESGLLPEIIFGRNEPALTWLHDPLDAAVGAHRSGEPPARAAGTGWLGAIVTDRKRVGRGQRVAGRLDMGGGPLH